MRKDQAHAYVESLLEMLTDAEKVIPDSDGDYPVRFRNSAYFVRIGGRFDSPHVQVFSIVLDKLEASPELMDELNRINANIAFARAFYVKGQVLIETDILAESLDPSGFENACACVGGLSEDFAKPLQEKFGGKLYPESPSDRGGPPPPSAQGGVGQYL